MRQNKLVLFFVFVISCFLTIAQDIKVVRDFELRTSAEISKEIIDDLELSYAQEIRLNTNASTFDNTFAEFGANYKINKYLKIGADYRFYRSQQWDGDYENQQRWSVKARAKYKLDRFTFNYKIQLQNKDEDFWANDSDNQDVYNLRNKFYVSYNIPKIKLKPEISAELFRRYYTGESEFSKIRVGANLSYPIKKWLDAEIGYYLDQELNVDYPASIHMLQVGFKFNF